MVRKDVHWLIHFRQRIDNHAIGVFEDRMWILISVDMLHVSFVVISNVFDVFLEGNQTICHSLLLILGMLEYFKRKKNRLDLE